MKILALAPHLNPTAGWATIPANVLPKLSDEYEVVALVGSKTKPEFQDRYDFDVRAVLPAPLETYHPVRVLQTAYTVRKHVSSDIDFVHSFIAYPYLPVATLATLGTGTPVTATALGTYAIRPLSETKQRPLLSWSYRRAAHIFSISEYTNDRITSEVGDINSSINPLGIDLERFSTENIDDENYILSVGAIKKRKSQDLLVEAFAQVVDEFPSVTLKIAGPIHEESVANRIETILDEHGIADRVELLGMVDDQDRLQRLYANCSFFALTPSEVADHIEGFGLVYLEAAAYGKPAVGTISGGVPTAVQDGKTGLLAEEGDVSGIASALRQLLGDDEKRKRLGQNARDRAEKLTWSAHTKALQTVWENVVHPC